MEKSHFKWYLIIIATLLFWGTQHPALRVISVRMDPLLFSFVRFFLAALVLLPFVIPKKPIIKKQDLQGVIFLGVLLALFGVVNVYGISKSTASNNSILVNTWPLLVVLLAPLLIKEKWNMRALLGCFIGFLGAYLVFSNGTSLFSNTYLFGNSIIFLSALIFAIYAIKNKSLIHTYGGLVVTFWTAVVSSLLLFVIVLLFGNISDLFILSWHSFFVIFWIAVPTTALTWVIWFKTIQKIGLVETSAFFFLLPLFGIFFNWLFLKETLSVYFLVGMILVLIGVSIAQMRKNVYKS